MGRMLAGGQEARFLPQPYSHFAAWPWTSPPTSLGFSVLLSWSAEAAPLSSKSFSLFSCPTYGLVSTCFSSYWLSPGSCPLRKGLMHSWSNYRGISVMPLKGP